MRSLFVTGASGFVGRHVLARLAGTSYGRVVCLSRWVLPAPASGGPLWARGDLRDPASYAAQLEAGADILHLAAATGTAAADAQAAVNVGGTAGLLGACARAGVRRFVHVSSIAARFPDDPEYPYARAKREAEAVVRGAGVPYVIVRPTIVIGPNGPIWRRLRGLATGPVAVVIGSGRTRIQPIFAGDLAGLLLELLKREDAGGRTLELGGPEVVTVEAFLRRIRELLRGRSGPLVRVPLGPLRAAAFAAARLLGPATPVSPGQLASFAHDGVAEPNAVWEEWRGAMLGVDAMIRAAADRG